MKTNEQRIVSGDFSVTVTEALDIAAAMARLLGTELVLVHGDEFRGRAPVDPKLFEATLLIRLKHKSKWRR